MVLIEMTNIDANCNYLAERAVVGCLEEMLL